MSGRKSWKSSKQRGLGTDSLRRAYESEWAELARGELADPDTPTAGAVPDVPPDPCRRIEIDHNSSCDHREPSIFGNDFECCASSRDVGPDTPTEATR